MDKNRRIIGESPSSIPAHGVDRGRILTFHYSRKRKAKETNRGLVGEGKKFVGGSAGGRDRIKSRKAKVSTTVETEEPELFWEIRDRESIGEARKYKEPGG